jgi:hypothetical protein
MPYQYALLCMHGMGDLGKGEFKEDIAKVKQELAERMPDEQFSQIYIPEEGVFYSDITQKEEVAVWEAMADPKQGGLDTGLIRRNINNQLRKFIIYGFSDAMAFTGFDGSPDVSGPYTEAQECIRKALGDIYQQCGKDVKIVMLTHSLGCQVMSNYVWDAQLHARNMSDRIDSRSIWSASKYASTGDALLDEFLHLKSLKTWVTTGCNIPIFVSGFKDVRAVDNQNYDYDFDWVNYFDYDDVLGWPLRPLNVLFKANKIGAHGRSYADVVTDIQVNANDGILGAITSSWNPLAHTQYWGDNTVLKELVSKLT